MFVTTFYLNYLYYSTYYACNAMDNEWSTEECKNAKYVYIKPYFGVTPRFLLLVHSRLHLSNNNLNYVDLEQMLFRFKEGSPSYNRALNLISMLITFKIAECEIFNYNCVHGSILALCSLSKIIVFNSKYKIINFLNLAYWKHYITYLKIEQNVIDDFERGYYCSKCETTPCTMTCFCNDMMEFDCGVQSQMQIQTSLYDCGCKKIMCSECDGIILNPLKSSFMYNTRKTVSGAGANVVDGGANVGGGANINTSWRICNVVTSSDTVDCATYANSGTSPSVSPSISIASYASDNSIVCDGSIKSATNSEACFDEIDGYFAEFVESHKANEISVDIASEQPCIPDIMIKFTDNIFYLYCENFIDEKICMCIEHTRNYFNLVLILTMLRFAMKTLEKYSEPDETFRQSGMLFPFNRRNVKTRFNVTSVNIEEDLKKHKKDYVICRDLIAKREANIKDHSKIRGSISLYLPFKIINSIFVKTIVKNLQTKIIFTNEFVIMVYNLHENTVLMNNFKNSSLQQHIYKTILPRYFSALKRYYEDGSIFSKVLDIQILSIIVKLLTIFTEGVADDKTIIFTINEMMSEYPGFLLE